MSNNFFITGCVRSGTTLLEKLLCNHPQLSVLAQPYPLLYVAAKQAFFATKGIEEYFALSHYVQENRYTLAEFNEFIREQEFSPCFVRAAFSKSYSGQLTQSSPYIGVEEEEFASIYSKLVTDNSHNMCATLFGSKEVLCEEFVPYYLNKGIKVIHIVRDPRDVIASIKKGDGGSFIGNVKPLLFELRNWRKSAQLAIQFKEHNNFITIKYEELVVNTMQTLLRLTNFLNIESFSTGKFNSGILDQSGKQWAANSSFEKEQTVISSKSIGRHKQLLPQNTLNYILAICYPELVQLNLLSKSVSVDDNSIMRFEEPTIPNDENIDIGYSTTLKNIDYEKTRLSKYADGIETAEFKL